MAALPNPPPSSSPCSVMSSILEDKGAVQRSLLLGACAAGPPLGGGPVHRGGGPFL
jgi:hypothetical protein